MSKIILIGSGNVATQLGIALKRRHHIVEVCSPHHAHKLAKKLSAKPLKNVSHISTDADIYIIAVNDDAIADVVKKMPNLNNKLIIHTSGATEISVLKKKFNQCGVLWQIQTIQQRNEIDFKKIPLVIEAANTSSLKKLKNLAACISTNVYPMNSHQRKVLHLVAVLINNFPNHLYFLGETILKKHRLAFKLFHPLMLSTTINKMKNPKNAQTGPAKRNDKKTMKAHLQLLSDNKNLKKIYSLISKSIYQNR